MALARPMVASGDVPARKLVPGDLIAGGENILGGAIATAGDGTWTGAAIANGIINRTGPGGGYTDTTDTAANIIAALAGNGWAPDQVVGTTFRLLVRNTVAQALTFAAGAGVVAGTGTLNIAASLVRTYIFTILNATPPVTVQSNTTNASKVVTFVLPGGLNAFLEGPSQLALNLSPGMTVSGTGITAGTKILSVTQGQGGIVGVGLDTNATATSAAGGVALTFGPTIQVDSIQSATL